VGSAQFDDLPSVGKENPVTIAIPEELPPVPDKLSQASAAAAYSAVPAPPSYAAPAVPTATDFTLSTVDLSQNTQAHILQAQGDSPSEIAQSLDTTIAVVEGYLGTPVAAATVTPAEATATGEGVPTQSTTVPPGI
jgi:hypothetical protein